MELEEKIMKFWDKVTKEYDILLNSGVIAQNTNYNVFQTPYSYPSIIPDLMIIGINPRGCSESGCKWLTPQDGKNLYISGEDTWFQTLRNIFGFPHNEILKPYLENCVGSNKVFINTSCVKRLPKSKILGPSLIRELVSKIIQPKHIVSLGKDVFSSLKNREVKSKEFGNIKLLYSQRDDIPICYIPNPSRINAKYFNQKDKLDSWQEALEWFLLVYKPYENKK